MNGRKVFLYGIFVQSWKTIWLAGAFHLNNTLSRIRLCFILFDFIFFCASFAHTHQHICTTKFVCMWVHTRYPSYHLTDSKSVRGVAWTTYYWREGWARMEVFKKGSHGQYSQKYYFQRTIMSPIFSHSSRPLSRPINVRIKISCIGVHVHREMRIIAYYKISQCNIYA